MRTTRATSMTTVKITVLASNPVIGKAEMPKRWK